MLKLVLEVAQAPAAHGLEEDKLVTDLFEGRVPFILAVGFVRDEDLWLLPLGWLSPEIRDETPDELVRDEPDDHCHRHRDRAENERCAPLRCVQPRDGEGLSTNEDDEDLPADDDKLDAQKPTVAERAFEDVDVVVQTAAAGKEKEDHLARSSYNLGNWILTCTG